MNIKEKRFGEERALYGLSAFTLQTCAFEGEEDGESALKECSDFTAENCHFALRYPLWHATNACIRGGDMTEGCRAALWYCSNVSIEGCKMLGIKALRECDNTYLKNCTIVSPEFGWRCRSVCVEGGELTSEYAFFESRDLTIDRLKFAGKYSFQYCKNVTIKNSVLNTKDAFWHAENVTVYDSEVKGEYLGWYSRGLTLVRCKISGTQPLCYCEDLRLVDCTMEGCDLSFENSCVQAEVKGEILSVKNPRQGSVIADRVGEIVLQESVHPVRGDVFVRDGRGKLKKVLAAGKKV